MSWHHAQRADDRAVDPAQQQRQQNQRDDHADIQGEQRGQELDLRRPTQPRMNRPREVEEQGRDRNEKQYGKCQS